MEQIYFNRLERELIYVRLMLLLNTAVMLWVLSTSAGAGL